MADGSYALADGTVLLPNGDIKRANGDILMPDGTVKKADGTIILPDGTMGMPGCRGWVACRCVDCAVCRDVVVAEFTSAFMTRTAPTSAVLGSCPAL